MLIRSAVRSESRNRNPQRRQTTLTKAFEVGLHAGRNFDAVLTVERLGEAEAEVVYIVPDYPPWYIKASVRRAAARIARREAESGERLSLIVPYEPLKTTMECWFEGNEFKGIMYCRFMKQVILWTPLE